MFETLLYGFMAIVTNTAYTNALWEQDFSEHYDSVPSVGSMNDWSSMVSSMVVRSMATLSNTQGLTEVKFVAPKFNVVTTDIPYEVVIYEVKTNEVGVVTKTPKTNTLHYVQVKQDYSRVESRKVPDYLISPTSSPPTNIVTRTWALWKQDTNLPEYVFHPSNYKAISPWRVLLNIFDPLAVMHLHNSDGAVPIYMPWDEYNYNWALIATQSKARNTALDVAGRTIVDMQTNALWPIEIDGKIEYPKLGTNVVNGVTNIIATNIPPFQYSTQIFSRVTVLPDALYSPPNLISPSMGYYGFEYLAPWWWRIFDTYYDHTYADEKGIYDKFLESNVTQEAHMPNFRFYNQITGKMPYELLSTTTNVIYYNDKYTNCPHHIERIVTNTVGGVETNYTRYTVSTSWYSSSIEDYDFIYSQTNWYNVYDWVEYEDIRINGNGEFVSNQTVIVTNLLTNYTFVAQGEPYDTYITTSNKQTYSFRTNILYNTTNKGVSAYGDIDWYYDEIEGTEEDHTYKTNQVSVTVTKDDPYDEKIELFEPGPGTEEDHDWYEVEHAGSMLTNNVYIWSQVSNTLAYILPPEVEDTNKSTEYDKYMFSHGWWNGYNDGNWRVLTSITFPNSNDPPRYNYFKNIDVSTYIKYEYDYIKIITNEPAQAYHHDRTYDTYIYYDRETEEQIWQWNKHKFSKWEVVGGGSDVETDYRKYLYTTNYYLDVIQTNYGLPDVIYVPKLPRAADMQNGPKIPNILARQEAGTVEPGDPLGYVTIIAADPYWKDVVKVPNPFYTVPEHLSSTNKLEKTENRAATNTITGEVFKWEYKEYTNELVTIPTAIVERAESDILKSILPHPNLREGFIWTYKGVQALKHTPCFIRYDYEVIEGKGYDFENKTFRTNTVTIVSNSPTFNFSVRAEVEYWGNTNDLINNLKVTRIKAKTVKPFIDTFDGDIDIYVAFAPEEDGFYDPLRIYPEKFYTPYRIEQLTIPAGSTESEWFGVQGTELPEFMSDSDACQYPYHIVIGMKSIWEPIVVFKPNFNDVELKED